ncbi:MAG: hypothetical protein IAG10_09890 [Planctomycetaceae bacterium]|nr:hypothetical protein [Planctomycetaceae bacterium]
MASISVQISERLLQSLRCRATKQRKSLEKEVVELIATGLQNADAGSDELDEVLQSLELMTGDDLWNAARSRLQRSLSSELEKLHQKGQRDGMTKAERERARLLTEQFERCLVIRARAIELLHARSHDVSRLLPS